MDKVLQCWWIIAVFGWQMHKSTLDDALRSPTGHYGYSKTSYFAWKVYVISGKDGTCSVVNNAFSNFSSVAWLLTLITQSLSRLFNVITRPSKSKYGTRPIRKLTSLISWRLREFQLKIRPPLFQSLPLINALSRAQVSNSFDISFLSNCLTCKVSKFRSIFELYQIELEPEFKFNEERVDFWLNAWV